MNLSHPPQGSPGVGSKTDAERSVYLELTSGLGNQLIQWATAIAVADKAGDDVRLALDARKLWRPSSRGFGLQRVGLDQRASRVIDVHATSKTFWSFLATRTPKLHGFVHNRIPLAPPTPSALEVNSGPEALKAFSAGSDSVWLRGYMQEPEFFWSRRALLKDAFLQSFSTTTHAVERVNADLPNDYAAIHVRRGDYLSHPQIGVCSSAYYQSAQDALSRDLPVFIVTDDVNWCRAILLPTLRGHVTVATSGDDLIDLEILRRARQLVISNSTFSWWAAFVGDQEAVVAPSPWLDEGEYSADLTGLIATTVHSKSSGERLK